jgi:uncharacterized membrane protein
MAQFTVCNENTKLAYVAMGYWDNLQYVSDGWWTVEPGKCAVTYDGALQYQFYYIYGETESDKAGNVLTWGGDVMLCVNPANNYTIWGDITCDTGFIEIDIGKATDWSFTLQ